MNNILKQKINYYRLNKENFKEHDYYSLTCLYLSHYHVKPNSFLLEKIVILTTLRLIKFSSYKKEHIDFISLKFKNKEIDFLLIEDLLKLLISKGSHIIVSFFTEETISYNEKMFSFIINYLKLKNKQDKNQFLHFIRVREWIDSLSYNNLYVSALFKLIDNFKFCSYFEKNKDLLISESYLTPSFIQLRDNYYKQKEINKNLKMF